jgi:hypothetical protein
LGTRHSLRPLFSLGEKFLQTSGASRREIAESCFGNWGNVIARSESDEAIHSSFAARWIASLSLSSGALRATRWLAMTVLAAVYLALP